LAGLFDALCQNPGQAPQTLLHHSFVQPQGQIRQSIALLQNLHQIADRHGCRTLPLNSQHNHERTPPKNLKTPANSTTFQFKDQRQKEENGEKMAATAKPRNACEPAWNFDGVYTYIYIKLNTIDM
jgi:hypothetical protein